MNSLKIHDLQSLHREKDRLTLMVQMKEKELETTGNYLRMNIKGMMWNYINPFGGDDLIGQAFQLIKSFVSPKMGMGDGGAMSPLKNATFAGIAASLAGTLVKKFIKKRRARKKEAKETEKSK